MCVTSRSQYATMSMLKWLILIFSARKTQCIHYILLFILPLDQWIKTYVLEWKANEPRRTVATHSERCRLSVARWCGNQAVTVSRCFICEQTNSHDALTVGASGKLKLSPLVDDALCTYCQTSHLVIRDSLYSLAVDDINHSLSELFELTALGRCLAVSRRYV